MASKRLHILLVLILICTSYLSSHQEQSLIKKVFIRATIYPTYSLSRYDYNNDIDLVEIRTYVVLRYESQSGEIIPNAQVIINMHQLPFKKDHYEKKIKVSKEKLPEEIILKIRLDNSTIIEAQYPIPDWLLIQTPRPAILDPSKPISLTWKFTNLGTMANIRVYDYKSGVLMQKKDNYLKTALHIPVNNIPKATILRIYVISSWFFKKFITGDHIAMGSEIHMIPWSQVFARIQ